MKKLLPLLAITIIILSCSAPDDGGGNLRPEIYPPQQDIYGRINANSPYYKPGSRVIIDGTGWNSECTVGLKLQGEKSTPVQAKILEHNDYQLIFEIPTNLVYGTYDVLIIGPKEVNCGIVILLPEIKGGPVNKPIAYTNISDARTIYTSMATSTANGIGVAAPYASGINIYKITKDNKSEKVIFTAENGDLIQDVTVHYFKDMSQKYLYMIYEYPSSYDTLLYSKEKGLIGNIKHLQYGDEIGSKAHEFWTKLRGSSDPDQEDEEPTLPQEPLAKPDSLWYEFAASEIKQAQVIIQKADNAIFRINPADVGNVSQIIDAQTEFQVDYNENIYFCPKNMDGIFKIYTHGKEVYIKKVNNNEWVDYSGWLVDRRGNVIINNQYARLVSDEFTRLPENAFENRLLGFFINHMDSEGFLKLRMVQGEWQNNMYLYDLYIDCISAQAPTMILSQQKHLSTVSAIGGQKLLQNGQEALINPFGVYVYKDKTVISRICHQAGMSWIVTLNNKNDIQETLLPDQEYPQQIGFKYYGSRFPCTEKFLYGMSTSEIWRLGIETGTPEMIYKYDQEYDIKSIDVKNGVVTFRALELRKATYVVGEIYPDKTVKIIEAANNDLIIYLEQIN